MYPQFVSFPPTYLRCPHAFKNVNAEFKNRATVMYVDRSIEISYIQTRTYTHSIHSTDPLFCHMASWYKTSRNTVKIWSHNTISGHVSETIRQNVEPIKHNVYNSSVTEKSSLFVLCW